MRASPLSHKWFLCAVCCLAFSGAAFADPINAGPGTTRPISGSFFDVFFELSPVSDMVWILPIGGMEPPPGGPPETVPIELVALHLVSVQPVNIGGSFFDVFIELDFQSQGEIHLAPNGHFDSFFDVFIDITLDEIGGGTLLLPHTGKPLRMSGDWRRDQQGNLQLDRVTVIGTPEPATLFLVGSALALAARRRRR